MGSFLGQFFPGAPPAKSGGGSFLGRQLGLDPPPEPEGVMARFYGEAIRDQQQREGGLLGMELEEWFSIAAPLLQVGSGEASWGQAVGNIGQGLGQAKTNAANRDYRRAQIAQQQREYETQQAEAARAAEQEQRVVQSLQEGGELHNLFGPEKAEALLNLPPSSRNAIISNTLSQKHERPKPEVRTVGGKLVSLDPETGQPSVIYNDPSAGSGGGGGTYRTLTEEEATAMNFPPGGVYQINNKGKINAAVSPSASNATESERLAGYHTKLIANNLREIAPFFSEGSDGFAKILSTNWLGNYQNEEAHQRYRAAGLKLVDSALRLSTGANAPAEEVEREFAATLPQPGDKPGTIAQKSRSLIVLLEAAQERAGRAAVPDELIQSAKQAFRKIEQQQKPAPASAASGAPAQPAPAPAAPVPAPAQAAAQGQDLAGIEAELRKRGALP